MKIKLLLLVLGCVIMYGCASYPDVCDNADEESQSICKDRRDQRRIDMMIDRTNR